MKRCPASVLAVVILCSANVAAGATLTEWRLPFVESLPLQIEVSDGAVYYTIATGDQPTLGRLNIVSGRVSEWSIPLLPSTPGEIKVRSADGALFIPDVTNGEIEQFDPRTQVLRTWAMPDSPAFGPFDVTLDAQGRVLFAVPSQVEWFICRLDTGTGALERWLIPMAMDPTSISVLQVALVGGDKLFFNITGSEETKGVGRLDLSNGTFKFWPVAGDPAYDLEADPFGSVFFKQFGPFGDTGEQLVRLVPETGRQTGWTYPSFSDDLLVAGGLVFLASREPPGISAHNPFFPGEETLTTPIVSEPVVAISTTLVPVESSHRPTRSGTASVSRHVVHGRPSPRFVNWPVAGNPRFLATDRLGTVYFNDELRPVIARLSP